MCPLRTLPRLGVTDPSARPVGSRRRESLLSFTLAATCLGCTTTPGPMPEGGNGSWWLGVDMGLARVETDGVPGSDTEDGWVLSFAGGGVAGEHWLLGAEVGGVGFESGDLWDPSEGRSLGDAFLVAEYHPSLAGGWFLQTAGGWTSYTDNGPGGGALEGDGWGLRLGPGYEWEVGPHNHLHLLATYGYGSIEADAGRWSYDALALSLGWSFR